MLFCRDFTYIDDIVKGVTRVIDNPPVSTVLNSGQDSARELAPDAAPSSQHNAYSKGADNKGAQNTTKVENHEKSTDASKSSPLGELEGALMQPGDVPRTEADVSDLVEELGYKPDTPVQKGIENFIEWYKKYFGIH